MTHNIASRALRSLLLAGACALSPAVLAQSQALVLSPQAAGYLERARILMKSGNNAGTIDQLRLLRPDMQALPETERQECAFLIAKAFYERGSERCVELLRDYVADYPASARALEARLTIADYYFFARQYGEARRAYGDIDISALNTTDRNLYTYREALCMVKTGDAEAARRAFSALQNRSDYREAATFYLAYIDYLDGNYDAAERGFSAVARGPQGHELDAEAYLVQIAFRRGRFSEAAQRGAQILPTVRDEELLPELSRVVGESYFKLGDSAQAEHYLRTYMAMAGRDASPSAVYALGVIDYDAGRFGQAAERFSTLTDERDAIGQSAYLYLGQLAVRDGDASAAAMSFEKAYRMGFDRNVTETALYNYVASRTRGGNVPFGSSVEMLENFLSSFPNSQYGPAVQEYLATAYFNEHDYSRALASINRIPRPSAAVLAAKQKVLYELGVEALSNGRAADAASYMKQAIALAQYDREVAIQARLWLADALYSQALYPEAEREYKSYLQADPRGRNRALALYDLAYCLYMQDNFRQAIGRFQDALSATPALAAQLKADATVRLADCRYYTGDFRGARETYAKALQMDAPDAAYAAYRHAVMQGLAGDHTAKLRELDAISREHPASKWIPLAQFEKAMTLSSAGDAAAAERTLRDLIEQYPSAPEARKGMLQLALNYSAAGRSADAQQAYKEVIRLWPSSEEASLANEDLRVIYARTGELPEYQRFLASVKGAPSLDSNEIERLTYDAAANAFAADEKATARLETYVNEYPNGRYVAQALLDLASGAAESGDYDRALEFSGRLLSTCPDASQGAEALRLRAEMLEFHSDGSAREALAAYRELERRGGPDYAPDAYAGIMRLTTSPKERLTYARRLRQTGGLTSEQSQEAAYFEARALLDSGNDDEAETLLRQLADNPVSLRGSQAVVALGRLMIDSGRLAEAERLLSTFTEEGTPHQYELAQAYIALADVYHANGKNYLALEYLRSLKQNYPGKELDIHDMINQRLNSWK